MNDRTFEVWYLDHEDNEEIELIEDVEDAAQAEELFWDNHYDDPSMFGITITKVIEVV